jgi:predicted dehydrogenase
MRVALVGFGWWGQHIARRLIANKDFELACVVEPMLSAHDAIRDLGLCPTSAFEDAFSYNIEGIILTSPNNQHDLQVEEAFDRGVHVFCEKPLSLSSKGARTSVRKATEKNLVLGIGHERRFEPAIIALRQLLKQGELGTIMHTEMAFSHNKLIGLGADSWRTSKAMAPAAGMTQMGIHLTDLLISFFGKVKTVAAFVADRSLGWETGDVVAVQLEFEKGMTAQLQAILHTPHFLRTHVFGTDMWVEIRNATHPDTPGGKVTMECFKSIDSTNIKQFEWTDSVTANLVSWANACKGKEDYPYTHFELVHNIEVLEAIVKSADEKTLVKL